MVEPNLVERKLRFSGLLVLLGILVEGVALRWSHPMAFLMLAFIGIPLVMVGVLLFLWSLVSESRRRRQLSLWSTRHDPPLLT